MTRSNQTTAIVVAGQLTSEDLPASFSLASPYWLSWLETHKKFRFECSVGDFTAYKLVNGWVAQKRVNGKLRQRRLGTSIILSRRSNDELIQVALEMNSSLYWQNKQQNNPDYLKHRINQLEKEVEKWKDEVYRVRQSYESCRMTDNRQS